MIFNDSWIRLCEIGPEYMCCMRNLIYSLKLGSSTDHLMSGGFNSEICGNSEPNVYAPPELFSSSALTGQWS